MPKPAQSLTDKMRTSTIGSDFKYRIPFYINTLPVIIWDFETLDIIDVNEEAVAVYGYSREEFLKMNTRQIRPPEDIALLEEVTKTEESYGNVHKRVWRHLNKNGELLFFEVSGYIVTIDGRRVVITHNYNITEKITSEKKLKESEEQYRLMFNKMPVPMVIYSLTDYQVMEVNETAVNHYGYTRDEFLKMTAFDYRPRERFEELKTTVENLDTADKVHQMGVFDHVKKDGTTIKVDISGHRINYHNNDCLMVVYNDVTEKEKALAQIKENEQKLRDSKQQLMLIYSNIKDVVFLLDVEENNRFRFSSVNQAFTGITGVAVDDAIGKYVEDIVPEPSLTMVLSKYSEAINTKNKVTWEETTHFINGTKSGIVSVTPIFNNEGGCTQLVGSVYDITERKKEEHLLRLMESVITNTRDSVLITEAEPFDGEGPRILYVNDAFTKMTGYTAEEVIGKTPRILQGPKSDHKGLKRLGDALRRWESYEITTINYKKNGEEFWINFNVTPVADEKGWFTHWIAVERDVTQQKKDEELLQSAYNERNTILESIDDGFFAIDNNWIVTYWNKRAETMMNKRREDILMKDLRDVYPIVPGRVSYTYYEKAFQEKESQRFEIYNADANIWLEVNVYPSAAGLSIYFKDITERLNHTKTIEGQNKRLLEIAWMQSHLTRAPVANILGLMDLLNNGILTMTEKEELLKYLSEATGNLDEVIKSIIQKSNEFIN